MSAALRSSICLTLRVRPQGLTGVKQLRALMRAVEAALGVFGVCLGPKFVLFMRNN